MKTAVMKLKDIRPAAYNPRVTLKPGDKDYEALKNSLERFGVALRRPERFLDRRIGGRGRRCRLPAGHGVAHLLP